ncbi:Outer membrane protein beta-barrel domain-containing protein [Chryseolinea serpens]|uniref:Outer membrane protein beta-barrel domain-containing protein n=1 Tax=Chryseolinea serpens TaxID=947013 RepID=A0A1M5WQW8_9BACT|nr:outer membrane beta-barrel protein [Chryseolinea serpens]SHH89947.1 Outer membrane protein beta-barrel domain-containing protein [Chryseolinea serpens]
MKKLLWIIFLIPLVTHAQFKKGDVYLGGTFSHYNAAGTFYITPFVGYFVNPRLALGADLQLSSSRSESAIQYADGIHQAVITSRGVVLSLNARRLYTLSDKFFFALQGEIDYQRSFIKQEVHELNSTTRYNFYGFGLVVSPRFIYFPSSRWSIEGGLGSLGCSFSRNLSNDTNTQSVGLNLGQVTLGFAYYFRKQNST